MWAVEVVVVEPRVELLVAFQRGLIGPGVRPFSDGGLDEAFCLSIGAGSVGSGEAVFDTSRLDDLPEAPVAIAGAIVGEDALDGEAEARVEGSCHEEEEKSGAVLLIGQDGGEADPAVVVDVQVLVACASGLARSVSVDAVAGLDDARQPLDIEVDEAARPLVLVAHDRGRRIERLEPVHAVAAKDAADGSAAQAKRVGDPPAVVAQPAKSQNLF